MDRYRLGFPVQVMGASLRSHDSRRWQNHPHLSVSLAYLRDILAYLQTRQIFLYRIAGQIAPYLTHPSFPAFHRQIDECLTELAVVGELARAYHIRLTMHPGHYVQLAAPEPGRVARSRHELVCAATLLDAMGADEDAILVIHVGGRYADKDAALARFARNVTELPAAVQRRLALENDDHLYSLEDTLTLHRRTGLPVVLDTLHHRCHNTCGRDLGEALDAALASWPATRRPKLHLSSPRTALRLVNRGGNLRPQMPLPNQHSDFIDPFAAIDLLKTAVRVSPRTFDVMLEAKAKDLSLLRLRAQIARYAPDLAARVI